MRAITAARDTTDEIQKVVQQYKNCDPAHVAGRVGEELHAGSFNINAANKGYQNLRAKTTANGDSADIIIKQGNKIRDKVQVKFGHTGEMNRISDPRYDGMQKVVASDRLKDVREYAAGKAAAGATDGNYADTANRVKNRIEHGKVKSDPVSNTKAEQTAANPAVESASLIRGQMLKAAKGTALTAAAFSATTSTFINIKDVCKGRKNAKTAAYGIVKDTANGGADGAIKGAATIGVQALLVRAGMKIVAKGSAPAVIAMTGVEIIKDTARASAGRISGKELAGRSGKHMVNGGAMWGGAKLGAMAGTAICPGIGSIIGGIIGGIGGSMLVSRLT